MERPPGWPAPTSHELDADEELAAGLDLYSEGSLPSSGERGGSDAALTEALQGFLETLQANRGRRLRGPPRVLPRKRLRAREPKGAEQDRGEILEAGPEERLPSPDKDVTWEEPDVLAQLERLTTPRPKRATKQKRKDKGNSASSRSQERSALPHPEPAEVAQQGAGGSVGGEEDQDQLAPPQQSLSAEQLERREAERLLAIMRNADRGGEGLAPEVVVTDRELNQSEWWREQQLEHVRRAQLGEEASLEGSPFGFDPSPPAPEEGVNSAEPPPSGRPFRLALSQGGARRITLRGRALRFDDSPAPGWDTQSADNVGRQWRRYHASRYPFRLHARTRAGGITGSDSLYDLARRGYGPELSEASLSMWRSEFRDKYDLQPLRVGLQWRPSSKRYPDAWRLVTINSPPQPHPALRVRSISPPRPAGPEEAPSGGGPSVNPLYDPGFAAATAGADAEPQYFGRVVALPGSPGAEAVWEDEVLLSSSSSSSYSSSSSSATHAAPRGLPMTIPNYIPPVRTTSVPGRADVVVTLTIAGGRQRVENIVVPMPPMPVLSALPPVTSTAPSSPTAPVVPMPTPAPAPQPASAAVGRTRRRRGPFLPDH